MESIYLNTDVSEFGNRLEPLENFYALVFKSCAF